MFRLFSKGNAAPDGAWAAPGGGLLQICRSSGAVYWHSERSRTGLPEPPNPLVLGAAGTAALQCRSG